MTFALATIVTVGVNSLAVGGFGLGEGVRRTLLVSSSILVIVLGVVISRRVWSGYIVVVGGMMNLLAIAANGGAMPVDVHTAINAGAFPENELPLRIGRLLDNSKDVPLARPDINLFLLADRFTVQFPAQPRRVYSAGDFMLALGVVAASAEVVVRLMYGVSGTQGADER